MPLHDDEPLEALLAGSRARAHQFDGWLDQIPAGDPVFAETTVLSTDTWGER